MTAHAAILLILACGFIASAFLTIAVEERDRLREELRQRETI